MRRESFDFNLPDELIAQAPSQERRDARLLHLFPKSSAGAAFDDLCIAQLPELLQPGDLLVMNDTRVVAARLAARKDTGGKVEILLERLLGPDQALAQLRSSKSPGEGRVLHLEGGAVAMVTGREGPFFVLRFADQIEHLNAVVAKENEFNLTAYLDTHGHMPLPPYIRRPDQAADRERYQTVYARHAGAVAAPTAGLHLDPEMLACFEARGIELAFVTLHVGAGTFAPMRVDEVETHQMHAEWLQVSEEVAQAVNTTRARGGRVVAVGTTVVRALESAAAQSDADGPLMPFAGETRIFIYPGYRFQVVDALLTNFHLPQSTLLMLVSAFAGTARMLAAYQHAVEQRYRFFSYGDAMFLHRAPPPSDDELNEL